MESKIGEAKSKMGGLKSKIGRVIVHKSKAKWAGKKANLVKAYSKAGGQCNYCHDEKTE